MAGSGTDSDAERRIKARGRKRPAFRGKAGVRGGGRQGGEGEAEEDDEAEGQGQILHAFCQTSLQQSSLLFMEVLYNCLQRKKGK